MTAGVAAELAARITEECFDFLEDPVVRIAGEDIPISVSDRLGESTRCPDADLVVGDRAETRGMSGRLLRMPRLGETMEERAGW